MRCVCLCLQEVSPHTSTIELSPQRDNGGGGVCETWIPVVGWMISFRTARAALSETSGGQGRGPQEARQEERAVWSRAAAFSWNLSRLPPHFGMLLVLLGGIVGWVGLHGSVHGVAQHGRGHGGGRSTRSPGGVASVQAKARAAGEEQRKQTKTLSPAPRGI